MFHGLGCQVTYVASLVYTLYFTIYNAHSVMQIEVWKNIVNLHHLSA